MTSDRNPFRPAYAGALLPLIIACVATPARALASAPTGDPVHGRTIFQQNCALCHATGQDAQATAGQGPVLGGVVGRPAASIPYFGYTRALRASMSTRDAPTLDRFLSNPPLLVPGTAMVVLVPRDVDRADLISYLATLPKVDPATLAALAANGQKSAGDWMNDTPGKVHVVNIDLLPSPFTSRSAEERAPDHGQARQRIAFRGRTQDSPWAPLPRAFRARVSSGPPRTGDLFIAETRTGDIRVLRAADGAGAPTENLV